MSPIKFSYLQLTFGQEEAYLHPKKNLPAPEEIRLRRHPADAPKGRFGLGVKIDDYPKTHQRLAQEYSLAVSCIKECWGAMWDPYSLTFKTLTVPKTADLAVSETKTSIYFTAELVAPIVTIATAIHADITADNVGECTAWALDALRRMCDYAAQMGVRLVFEATNHLEMGKYVNTGMNHHRMIQATGRDNFAIQFDWFHTNFEELNPYETGIDAGNLLWHIHFRDSNSLTPDYGTVDFKTVMCSPNKIKYSGFCTIESASMIPDSDTAAQNGITYLKMLERIAEYQLGAEFPNAMM